MEAFCIVVQFDRNGLSIAPYAHFSYLEKEEAGIEILPVRQDYVCRILPACRSPAAVKIEEAGAATEHLRGRRVLKKAPGYGWNVGTAIYFWAREPFIGLRGQRS
jgi:hypothetical protein